MPRPDRSDALDHVVVLMFENRPFDELLGRLDEPGEVASFEGVAGRELSNPIPAWAEHGADRKVIGYSVAPNMNTPGPDPGEEYQHVNTQLFGIIDPQANRGTLVEKMSAPCNAPRPGGRRWTGLSPACDDRLDVQVCARDAPSHRGDYALYAAAGAIVPVTGNPIVTQPAPVQGSFV
jgi:hypothetical protein